MTRGFSFFSFFLSLVFSEREGDLWRERELSFDRELERKKEEEENNKNNKQGKAILTCDDSTVRQAQ